MVENAHRSLARARTGKRPAVRAAAIVLLGRMAFAALMIAGTAMALVSVLPISVSAAKDGGSGHGGDHDGGGDHGGGGDSSGHGGGDDGGKGGDDSSRRGDDDSSGHGGKSRDRNVGRFLDTLKSRGRVVWSSTANGGIEVRYADGWSERVSGSTYSLLDPSRRSVVSRRAKTSDTERLRAVLP